MHQTSIKYVPKQGDLIHLSIMDQVTIGLIVSVRKCNWVNNRLHHNGKNKKLYDYSVNVLFSGRIRKFPSTLVALVQRHL